MAKNKCQIGVRKGFMGKGYDVAWGCSPYGTVGVKHFRAKKSAKTFQKVFMSKHRKFKKG